MTNKQRKRRHAGRASGSVRAASAISPQLAALARAQAAERAKGKPVEPPTVAPGSGVDDWREDK